jgi:hypothetical protein
MGQKGGQKGQESYHSDRVWVKKEVKMAFIKWVKNLTKKEVLPKMGHKGGQKGSKI